MKNLIPTTLLILLVLSSTAFAQTLQKPTTLSFEAGGRGGLYSLNFDRALSDQWSFGVGFSTWAQGAGFISQSVTILPFYANYYLSDSLVHRWFVTGGIDIVIAQVTFLGFASGGVFPLGTLGGGYEYRGESGFVFRGGIYTLIGSGVAVLPGLSVGYSF